MPEYLSNKKRKQSIGINSYSEYTDTTKIIGNVLVGFGSVGVGTTVPTQDVDVNTIRVRDTLFDYTNSGGEFGYYLVKDTDGIKWVAVPPIDSNAIFVAENNNILGVSSFTGLNIIADELLGVTPNPINPNFADITILPRWLKSGETGIYTTKNVGIGTTIPTTDFQVGFGTTGVTIDGSVGVVSAIGYYGNYAFIDQITVNDQLNVVGLGSTLVAAFLASGGGITTTGGDLYVGGSLFADKLDIINLEVVNINATGITTLNVGIVSTFRVTGVSTLGVTSTADLFVDANLEVSGISTLGITSTADLFVDENLYVVGIATATRFSTGVIGSAINITSDTISGPAEIIIDPSDVGDNSGAVRIKGDLYVDGEEFIVNSTTIELADFNVGIASTVGTNLLLDGAGIGIGSTNIRKTLTYDYSSDSLKSSENFDLESGKVYKINETEVLSSTQLTVANINATGVSTLGITTISELYVSGVSTFVGVGTFIDDLYVGRNLYVANDIFFDELNAKNANITGITTLNVGIVSTFRVTGVSTLGVTSTADLFVDGNLRVTGITTLGVTTISQLNVSGITTLGVTTTTNLTSQQLNVSGITTLGITSTTNLTSQQLNVSGITTLGVTTISELYVSGVSTFVGVGTFIDDLYVGEVLYANVVTGITSTTDLLVGGDLTVTGITTLGVTTISELYVSGITTLGITSTTNLTTQQLNVSGITTLGITSTTNLTSQQLNVSGITTLGITSTTNLTSQQLLVTGITTLASIVGTSLSISGISTIANFLMTPVGTGATVGGIGVTYYGDGSQLSKISSSSGYADTAGIATNVIGGIASVTSLNVTGITTLTSIVGTSLSISGISTLGVTSTTDLTTQQFNVSGITTLGITSATNLTSQQLNVTGVTTLTSIVGTSLSITGISTLGVTSTTNLTSQQLLVTGITTLASIVGTSLSISGISTLGVTSTTNLTSQQLNVSGITTLGITSTTNLSTQQLNVSGITTLGVTTTTNLTSQQLNVTGVTTLASIVGTSLSITGISTLGVTSTTNLTSQQLNVSGITTLGVTTISQLYVSGVSTFSDRITGIISTATKLETPRIISLTGDLGGSVSFDGSADVSIASTIQPNSVGLGTDTFGDYVKDITGTANQIIVTGGTGEGSSPILSIPNQFTAPQDVTVSNDLQVNRNLNVNGNITIGGTSAILFTQTFKVYDSDIILGVRTDGNGNDISTDNTANHGGIAIASTDGNPLIILTNQGIGETLPATYKKFMWFKAGSFAGLGTDAWLSNYAIGIGSTQFPTGTRLAAGSVQFTENDLAVVRNINASGIITATEFKGTLTGYASSAGIATNIGAGVTGSVPYQSNTGITSFVPNATENDKVLIWKDGIPVWGSVSAGSVTGTTDYANRAGIATYADNAGIATNLKGGLTGNIPYQLNPDITTFVDNSSATPTQVLRWNGFAPYWGSVDAGSITGVATYADRAGIAVTVIGGIASVTSLNVSGISTLGITSTTNLTAQQLLVTGITTLASIVGTSLSISGISTLGITSTTNLTTQQLNVTGIATLGVTSTTNLTSQQLNVSGVTTLASIVGTSLSISGISTLGVTSTTNLTSQQLNVSGITTLGITSTTNLTTQQLNVSGITTLASIVGTSLSISGISTLGVTSTTNLTSQQLNVSGITTLGITSISQLNVSGITTLSSIVGTSLSISGISTLGVTSTTNLTSQQLNVSGITTLGITSTTNLTSQQLNVTGITTLASIVGTSLSITGISTIANFILSPVGTGATVGGIGVTYYGDGSQLTDVVSTSGYADNAGIATNLGGGVTGNVPYQLSSGITTFVDNPTIDDKVLIWKNNVPVWGDISAGSIVGVATYADRAGIAVTVIGGIASVSQLNVTGITTLASIVGTSLSISGISTLGVTSTTDLTSQQLNVSGITTLASIVGTSLSISGISTLGVTSTTNLTSQQLLVTGITTLGITSTTNLTTQQLLVTGITTLGITSATNLTSQQLNVSGITTLASIVGTSLSITGISTIANFLMTPVGTGVTVGGIGVTYYGDGSNLTNIVSGYATTAGIATNATNVIGGIASVTSLNVTGITTLASIVGTSLSISGISTLGITSTTDLTTQQLNVSGITTLASIVGTSLSITGISTIANFRITNVGTGATVGGVGVLTYYGDGSQLTGLTAGVSISTNTTNQSQLIPYVTGTGSTTGFGVTTLFTYNPFSGNLGIGTTNPTSKLTVQGDVLVSGILTASRIVGTSLSISGISTIANFLMTPVGTGATVGGIGVTYYGDGSNLTGTIPNTIEDIESNQLYYPLLSPKLTGTISSISVSSTSLVFNPATNSLGINTTNPTSTLHISGIGTTGFTGGDNSRIRIGDFHWDDVYTTIHAKKHRSEWWLEQNSADNDGTDLIFYKSRGAPGAELPVQLNDNVLRLAGRAYSPNGVGIGSTITLSDWSQITNVSFDVDELTSTAAYGRIDFITAGVSRLLIKSSGNVGIGTTTPTSKLTVQGDVLVSGILTASHIVGTSLSISGISTIGSVKISSGIITSTTGGIVTYYGDGSKLDGVIATSSAVAISTNTANQSQFLTYVTETGSVSGLGVTTTGLVFNPFSGNLGIGTTTPTSKLTVQGDVLVSGILTASHIVGTSLSISGISTIANFLMTPVGTGATVGGIGVTYYGDGSNLDGVVGGLGGIGTAGGTVGTGITFLDFRGAGVSSITASAGIATITIPGASRSVKSYIATENQTTFAATYSIGYADVYLNGSKLSSPEDITSVSPPEYTASNGTSIELTQGASAGDIVEIVSYFINIVDTNISPVMMGMIF